MDFLKEACQAIYNLIADTLKDFWDLICEVWEWLHNVLGSVVQFFKDYVQTALQYLSDLASTYIVEPVATLFQASELRAVLETTHTVMTYIDFFLPFHEFLSLVGIFLTIWIACWIIKVVLKCIPTIY